MPCIGTCKKESNAVFITYTLHVINRTCTRLEHFTYYSLFQLKQFVFKRYILLNNCVSNAHTPKNTLFKRHWVGQIYFLLWSF